MAIILNIRRFYSNWRQNRCRPPWTLTLAALLLALLCLRLAVWQFSRAEQKAALEQSAQTTLAAAPILITNSAAGQPFQRAMAIGVYLPQHQILLDNRVHNKIAGAHIITPLLLANGDAVAVNRGWRQKYAAAPPPPPGTITVRGILQKDSADAFVLSAQTARDNVWQNLDLQQYAAAVNLSLSPLVLVAADGTDGLIPATVRINFKSQRSLGYAWQWLTFGLLTVVFYVIVGFKRR